MNIDRFRIIVIGRVFVLIATALLFLYLLMNSTLLMLTILMGILIVYQIYGLIHFVEKTNQEDDMTIIGIKALPGK